MSSVWRTDLHYSLATVVQIMRPFPSDDGGSMVKEGDYEDIQ